MKQLTQSDLDTINSIGTEKIANDLGGLIGSYCGGGDRIPEWIEKIEDALNEVVAGNY